MMGCIKEKTAGVISFLGYDVLKRSEERRVG